MVECLPSKCEALIQTPVLQKKKKPLSRDTLTFT
jgi:hypothetical protein